MRKTETHIRMGYLDQPIRCCAICKYASYSKTMCKKAVALGFSLYNIPVAPTGVCELFELRSTEQDEEYENAKRWEP